MRKIAMVAIAGTLALSLAAAGPAAVAFAREGDVVKTGSCSGSSTWKLKLSPESHSRIEAQFEVDQNVSGDTWRVRMLHDGDVVLRTRRSTQDPSGSFEVRAVVRDRAGTDTFVARARNVSTGETCVGRASI